MFVANAFGLYFPGWPDGSERYVQVAGIDCLTTAAGRKRCEELNLDPGKGTWGYRFLRHVSHELGRAIGLQDEGVTWDCGDVIPSAPTPALVRMERTGNGCAVTPRTT